MRDFVEIPLEVLDSAGTGRKVSYLKGAKSSTKVAPSLLVMGVTTLAEGFT